MNKRSIIFLSVSILVLVLTFCIALMVGRYPISFLDFINCVFSDGEGYEIQQSIIINLRLPRTLMACFVGIGLSLSGLLFQEIFQNKLTSPDLLGVSTGASVGASIAIILGLASVYVSLFAFVAGVATVVVTLLVARLFKNGSSVTLILAGIIVGGFMSALLSLVK